MGNRMKGRVKKKSIKASLSSSMGSTRKLSRMGKKQKRAHAGLESSFIGRARCLKMLQVNLKDFRRLCILKGIYPREALGGRTPGKKKGQTFYHIKDIRAIAHEPVLEKFRDFRAFMKKVRRAAGRNEPDEAIRKNALAPTYTLHHLVRERYPRFVDALSDLDDALTLTYLFAALPGSVNKPGDPHDDALRPKVSNVAKSLVAAWGAYCATTASITRSFISVKGIYMEAMIQGIPIRWIVPHSFTQFMPDDVDYRVMGTFFEFYEVLLNFVLFKLYNGIGVRYPFPVDGLLVGSSVTASGSTATLLGANLRALTQALTNASAGDAISTMIKASVEKNDSSNKDNKAPDDEIKSNPSTKKKTGGSAVKSVSDVPFHKLTAAGENEDEEENNNNDDDSVDVAGPLQAALESMAEEETRASVPGVASSSGEGTVDDEVLKRKRLFSGLTFFLSREVPRGYLELVCLAYGARVGWEGSDGSSPISITDPTITHHIVDRPKVPASYDKLPRSREYVQPQWIVDCANFMFLLPISKYAVGCELPPHLSPWVDDDEEGYKPAYAEEIARLKNGETVDAVDDEEEMGDGDADAGVAAAATAEGTKDAALAEESENDEDNDNDDGEDDQEESKEKVAKRETKRKKEEQDAHDMAKTMMSRKAAHLYNRMQHGIEKRKAKVVALHERRKEIDTSKEKNAAGKSVLKQKVERLKKERKSLEDTYTSTGGSMKKAKKSRKST